MSMAMHQVSKGTTSHHGAAEEQCEYAGIYKGSCGAALKELERQQGLKYVSDKLPKGSMLLEVRHFFLCNHL